MKIETSGIPVVGDSMRDLQAARDSGAIPVLVKTGKGKKNARDLKQVFPRFADTGVYRMSETTPAVTGHAGITERLGSWMQSSDRITFEILETFASGPIVINHRIDTFASKTRPLTWEGVGVFFIKDGKIQEWQDYTIRVVRPPAQ